MSRIFVTSLLLFVAGVLSCAIVAAAIGVRAPTVPDEFSYLLSAETFSNGRFTNPPHPMSEHFSRPAQHIIYEPTYMSKYPPGQGLLLWVGDWVFGSPIWGVWISVGLMAAAIYWMLLAWVPPRWAWVGGGLSILQFGFAHYWAQSFMGAALPAFGGALVVGAFGRFLCQVRIQDVFVFGLGLLVLALTRPFEGLALSLVPATFLLIRMVYLIRCKTLALAMRVVVFPMLIVSAVIFLTLAVYNNQVTGSALRLPYQVHNDWSNTAPILFVSRPTSQSLAIYEADGGLGWEPYLAARSVIGAWRHIVAKLATFGDFYLSPATTIVLLLVPWALRSRIMRWGIACFAMTMIAYILSTWISANYAAPAACIVILLVVSCLRRVFALTIGPHRTGRIIGIFVLFAQLIWTTQNIASESHRRAYSTPFTERVRIENEFSRLGGKHLVLVQHNCLEEHNIHAWTGVVFNSADIDGSMIVWAWKPTGEKEEELLNYFEGRRVWLFEYQSENLISQPMTLRPYVRESKQ